MTKKRGQTKALHCASLGHPTQSIERGGIKMGPSIAGYHSSASSTRINAAPRIQSRGFVAERVRFSRRTGGRGLQDGRAGEIWSWPREKQLQAPTVPLLGANFCKSRFVLQSLCPRISPGVRSCKLVSLHSYRAPNLAVLPASRTTTVGEAI